MNNTKSISTKREIKPQEGGQEAFLATPADICVFGGKAGAGKSFALLMEALRHTDNRDFTCVIFRRTCPQITNPDGLWDTAMKLYPYMGAAPKESSLEWKFPAGCRVKFAHMQYEKDKIEWDGAQICLLGFDQLEHFSWTQFSYMLARNRSLSGVKPYIRATCNPDPDHWLRTFMAWWIDDETGVPVPERSGIIRWFVIINDEVIWADNEAELILRFGKDAMPKSFTFIVGDIYENKALLQINPEYIANLKALYNVAQQRLLFGNWNARDSAGMFFQREWFEIVPAAPVLEHRIRYWDRAATAADSKNADKASWTAGVLMGESELGVFYILDVRKFQGSPLTVKQTIKNVASQDGRECAIGIEQDPGQAGKAEAEDQIRNLAGYNAQINTVHESKGLRAQPLSAQAQAGNVKLIKGVWNEDYLKELENFDGSDLCKSDQVDASSGAFYMLTADNAEPAMAMTNISSGQRL